MGRADRTVRDTSKLFAGHLGAAVWSVIFSAWLVRVLPRTELVVLPLWMTLTGLVQALSQLGMRDTLVRRVPEVLSAGNRAEAGRMLRCALAVNVAASAALCTVLFLAAQPIGKLFLRSAGAPSLVRVVVFGVFFAVLRLHFESGLSATQEFGRLAVVNAFCRITQAPLAVLLYAVSGIKGAALALALVPGTACLIAMQRLWPHLRAGTGITGLLGFVRYAAPFSAVGLLAFFSHRVDHALIGAFANPESWAGYYVAARLAEFVDQLGIFAFDAVNPKLAELRRRDTSEVLAAFAKCTRYLLLGFFPICVLGIVLGPRLVVLYGGPKYVADGPIMSLLCVYTFVSCFYAVHRGGILAYGARWHLLALQGMAAVINPLCLVLFLRAWQGIGAATGKVIGFLALSAISYYVLRLRVPARYDTEAVRLSLLAHVAMAAAAGLVLWLWSSPLGTIPAAALGAAVYVTVLRRRLTLDDVRLFVRILPGRLRESRRGAWLASAMTSFFVPKAQSQ